MGIIRVLLCIVFPPLAVLDRGCGSLLLVTIMTMLGWIPGILAALIISSRQQPHVVVVTSDGEVRQPVQPKGSGVLLAFGIILFAIVVAAVVGMARNYNHPKASTQTIQEDTKATPLATARKNDTGKISVSPPVPPVEPPMPPAPKSTVPNSHLLTSFGNVPLPATVTVIEPINLLNATGKETSFPPNTVIMIEKRSDSGTLTMKINGALFVGNEARLSKKTMLR